MHIEIEKLSDSFTKYHVRDAPFYQVYHHFTAPDMGDFHDHPFDMQIEVKKGSYIEERLIDGTYFIETIYRKQGDRFTIPAKAIHKIIELPDGECWTSMIPGLHCQDWGFYRFENGQAFRRNWDEKEFKLITR